MKEYKASIAPNPEIWLSMDEQSHLDLVFDYVNKYENNIEKTAKRIHASILYSSIYLKSENDLPQYKKAFSHAEERLRNQLYRILQTPQMTRACLIRFHCLHSFSLVWIIGEIVTCQ